MMDEHVITNGEGHDPDWAAYHADAHYTCHYCRNQIWPIGGIEHYAWRDWYGRSVCHQDPSKPPSSSGIRRGPAIRGSSGQHSPDSESRDEFRRRQQQARLVYGQPGQR